jgi:hypothetical protein
VKKTNVPHVSEFIKDIRELSDMLVQMVVFGVVSCRVLAVPTFRRNIAPPSSGFFLEEA